MKEIAIENFAKMSPDVPQYSRQNQNFYIGNCEPNYYKNGTREEQYAPLASAQNWTLLNGTLITGNVDQIISSTGVSGTFFLVTEFGGVIAINTQGTRTFLGFPTGSAGTFDARNSIAIGGNKIFMTYSTSGNVYYKNVDNSGVWNNFAGLTANIGVHFMVQFADHIAVNDGSADNHGVIRLIDPAGLSVLSSPTLDLGLGFTCLKMENYNDKYIAVAAGKVATGYGTNGYGQNYIYLWDGSGNNFNYSVKVPGRFIDMKVIDSILYVATNTTRGVSELFYLAGTRLKKVMSPQIATFKDIVFSRTPATLFDFKNSLGIHLDTYGSITDPLMVYSKDVNGTFEYVYSSGLAFDQFCTDSSGNILGTIYNAGGNADVYYIKTPVDVTTTYQNIKYKSQWIPVNNLQAIDIYYDNPPVNGVDAITVTIYGKGEDIITGSSTTVLDSITPSSILNTSRTRLDCKNFTGDKVMIELNTTIQSTWFPIIRKISIITA